TSTPCARSGSRLATRRLGSSRTPAAIPYSGNRNANRTIRSREMNSSGAPVKNSGPIVTSIARPKKRPRARTGRGSVSQIAANSAPNGAPASAPTKMIIAVPSAVKPGFVWMPSGTPSATIRIAIRAPTPVIIPAAMPQIDRPASLNIARDFSAAWLVDERAESDRVVRRVRIVFGRTYMNARGRRPRCAGLHLDRYASGGHVRLRTREVREHARRRERTPVQRDLVDDAAEGIDAGVAALGAQASDERRTRSAERGSGAAARGERTVHIDAQRRAVEGADDVRPAADGERRPVRGAESARAARAEVDRAALHEQQVLRVRRAADGLFEDAARRTCARGPHPGLDAQRAREIQSARGADRDHARSGEARRAVAGHRAGRLERDVAVRAGTGPRHVRGDRGSGRIAQPPVRQRMIDQHRIDRKGADRAAHALSAGAAAALRAGGGEQRRVRGEGVRKKDRRRPERTT